MRRDDTHTHKCERCDATVQCGGGLERNYDGWPDVICDVYHVHGRPDFLCEDCAYKDAAAMAADLAEQDEQEQKA